MTISQLRYTFREFVKAFPEFEMEWNSGSREDYQPWQTYRIKPSSIAGRYQISVKDGDMLYGTFDYQTIEDWACVFYCKINGLFIDEWAERQFNIDLDPAIMEALL